MLKIHKSYAIDENQQPVAVQIPIAEFEQIEAILANIGLAKEIEEPLLSIAGILSGEPTTGIDIEEELYGNPMQSDFYLLDVR